MEDIRDYAEKLKCYDSFFAPYQEVMGTVLNHLEYLKKELNAGSGHQAIHSCQSRLKSLKSMEKKLLKLERDTSFQAAREHLTDIAGIRVVCSYKKEVYQVAELLKKRFDFIIIKEKDYIACPKPNGYSSYHLIVGVSAYGLDGCKSYYPVEIQLRTMAMDFWASIEHQLCYKPEEQRTEELRDELKSFAEILGGIEQRMEKMSKSSVEIL